MESRHSQLTNSALLTRNTVFNIAGQSIPLLIAILAIPILINGLGTDRFGVLTLAWMVIGYFSIFDLGLGRALTKLVAEKLGCSQEDEIPALVWTCLFLMLMFGVVAAIVVSLLTPWLVNHILKIPKELRPETLPAFYLLAITIPIVISTAGLRGILEATQHFGIINVVRTTIGIFAFLGPLFVLYFSQSIFPIVLVLTICRLISWIVYILLCLHIVPALYRGGSIKRELMGPMLRFGGWITVSNIISPLMVYLDRFLIGGLLSMAAVAYYVTPYEVATKLKLIPSAIVGVLFPAFSNSIVQDSRRTALLFGRGVKCVILALFPIALFVIALAPQGLDLWLGKEFAQHSTRILQWLAIGMFINSLALFPSALIQGMGRPDLTTKLHIIELPFYLFGVWWLIVAHGIEGVAIAWLARVAVDTLILFGIARWLLPESAFVIKHVALILGAVLPILGLAMLPMGVTLNWIFVLLVLATFVPGAWFVILAPEERVFAQSWLKNRACFQKKDRF